MKMASKSLRNMGSYSEAVPKNAGKRAKAKDVGANGGKRVLRDRTLTYIRLFSFSSRPEPLSFFVKIMLDI